MSTSKSLQSAQFQQEFLKVETWVFRTQDFGDFTRFLKLRGFELEGQEATLTCRERSIDAEVAIVEVIDSRSPSPPTAMTSR
eukprot:4929273-Amphidinium_carterae.1